METKLFPLPDFIVEAGAHDGTDTRTWASLTSTKKVFAFEPDPEAYKLCQLATHSFKDLITLYPFCLSDTVGKKQIFFGDVAGDGSSQIREFSNESHGTIVDSVTLSWLLNNQDRLVRFREGLLWLDVEGHALSVLKGAGDGLSKINFIYVEVEFKDISPFRTKNWKAVISQVAEKKFYLYKADIHPGNFGNYFFVHKRILSPFARMRHFYLFGLSFVFRQFLYPVRDFVRQSHH